MPTAKKLFIACAAVAIAITAAGTASARSTRSAHAPAIVSVPAHCPAGFAYDAQGNPTYGFGPCVRVQRNDVVAGQSIIGRDPDPFIRGEILRHYHSGWPD